MKTLSIYKIENLNNGKLYIGCSGNARKRIGAHRADLAAGRHNIKEFQADYDKGDKFRAAEIFAVGVNDSFDDYIFGCAVRGVEAFYTVTLNSDVNGYNKRHVGSWRRREEARFCFPDPEGLSEQMRREAAEFRRLGWGNSRLRKVEILYDYERKKPADYTPCVMEFCKASKNHIVLNFNDDEAERIAEIFKAHGVKPSEVLRGAAAALLDGEPIRTEAAPLIAPQAAGEAQTAPDGVENDGTDGGEE